MIANAIKQLLLHWGVVGFYIEVRLADCHTQIFFLEGRFPLGTINEMWLNDIM